MRRVTALGMSRLRSYLSRIGGLFRQQRANHDLTAELESHLQMQIDANLKAGMSPEEARRQALIQLGGLEATKEAYRDQRSIPWLENLFQDNLSTRDRKSCRERGRSRCACLSARNS